MVTQKIIIIGGLAISGLSQAATITFDLRNLGTAIRGGYSLSEGGVTLSFSSQSPSGSQLVSTASGIGIDSGYAGEVSGLINGTVRSVASAESLFFMFSKDVVVKSVTLFWTRDGILPIIEPKGVGPTGVLLGPGTTVLPDLFVNGTSANTFLHSPDGYFPASAGFAIRSMTVATVPEPGGFLMGVPGAVLGLTFRRRRR